jgi:predicted nuclease of predicted toxin-antitoxin system
MVVSGMSDAGHEVMRLRDHLPVESPDAIVIAKAQDLSSILLSLNGDFSDIVTYPPQRYRGIVALHVRNHPEITPAIVSRLLLYLAAHPEMVHYQGKLLIVEPHRIRIRA